MHKRFASVGLIIFATLANITSSCRQQKNSQADLKWSESGQAGLAARLKDETVTICTNYPGQRDQEIIAAATAWFEALRALNVPDKTIPKVEVVQDVSDCDARVILEQLPGPANTTITERPDVRWDIRSDTWFGSYHVLIHEFGHAFGLYDTYVLQSGQAGNCQANQPRNSVMCSPFYDFPQEDDWMGVRSNLLGRRVGTDEFEAPNYADVTVPSGGSGYSLPNQNVAANTNTQTQTQNQTQTDDQQRPLENRWKDLITQLVKQPAVEKPAAAAADQNAICPYPSATANSVAAPVPGKPKEKEIRFVVTLEKPAAVVVLCLGSPAQCRGDYHQPATRLSTNNLGSDGLRFITPVLSATDLKALKETKNIISLSGLKADQTPFLCEMGSNSP